MGASSKVIAVLRRDEAKWEKMNKVKAACKEAGVELPDEAEDYFEEMGGAEFQEVDLPCPDIDPSMSERYEQDGLLLKVSDIPEGTTEIVFLQGY